MEERLTKREAAAFFGVSERTLERWAACGKLPAGVRSGRKVYWLKSACELAKQNMDGATERGLDAQFKRWRGAVLNG